MADRKAKKNAEQESESATFETVALLWHDHWKAGKSQQHADTIIRRLKRNVFPMLGNRPIAEIKTSEVVAMAKAVEARGVADLAKRALETTGQIFRYAIAHEYTEQNPAANIKPRDILKSTPKKNIARIDPKQLPALMRSIEVYRGTHVTRLGIKLMAHTFLRTGELIGGEWSEIDFAAARWDIPKERMKMKTPHIVPLSKQSIEILRLLQQITGGNKLMFPGDRDPRKPISNNTILFALGRMGYKYTMTGHGFRGLASTVLHEQGFEHQHIELQLAHMPRNAVSAAYNHALYLAPRAKMMQWWSNYLEEQAKL
jgi:integrase